MYSIPDPAVQNTAVYSIPYLHCCTAGKQYPEQQLLFTTQLCARYPLQKLFFSKQLCIPYTFCCCLGHFHVNRIPHRNCSVLSCANILLSLTTAAVQGKTGHRTLFIAAAFCCYAQSCGVCIHYPFQQLLCSTQLCIHYPLRQLLFSAQRCKLS